MKINSLFKPTALAIVLSALINPAFAETHDHKQPHALLKVQPSTVYQAAKGQSLGNSLQQIAQRSGIEFKINTDLSNDQVAHALASDSWDNAVRDLLSGYNYTTVMDGDRIKTVIITGHNGTSTAPSVADKTRVDESQLIVIAPKVISLPKKYHNFPAGAVTAVNLPVKQLMALKDGSKAQLDLPMGQFNVAHDRTVDELDGSKTWIGYLADEGEGYRILLSQGNAGTMGVVTTPDGSYNIESDGNNTFLVDTSKLKDTGYDGDTLEPPTMGAAALNATQSELTQLQTAVDSAKRTLDAANAQLTSLKSLLKTYQGLLATAQTNLNNALANQKAKETLYIQAYTNYNAKRTAAALTALNSAYSAYLNARIAYNNATITFQTTSKNVTNINASIGVIQKSITTAQANYDKAVAALNQAKAAPSSTTTATSTSTTTATTNGLTTIDLMVVYTTAGQTADYAKQRVNLLVTASNQAYKDSGINMRLRLVYTEPTTYVENNANSTALSDLAFSKGVFSTIAQKRSQYGADLVFLFRPLYAKTHGSCGTTYVEFANGTKADKTYGYGTVSDGNAKDSTGYYCAVNTFTHEIGHTLGLVHDREYSSFPGVFNYAYAWGVQGTFGTIMSYKSPVLMYFSTPSLATQCKGQPCGYATTDAARSSDQAKSVNYTAPIIADFMPTTTAVPVLK